MEWSAPQHASNTKAIDFQWVFGELLHEHESKIFSRLHKMVRESETFYTFPFPLWQLFVSISFE